MSNCIVSIGVGSWYPRGIARLKQSMDRMGYAGSSQLNTSWPSGCPPHAQTPYAFKAWAFKNAMESGHQNVLWLDSSCWVAKDITPVFDKIEKDGYFVLLNGWSSGHWCSDRQLEAFHVGREEAFSWPHPMGCMMGINFANPDGKALYEGYAGHTHLFPGPWDNLNKSVSQHPDVLGTRHDQSVLGLVAHSLGLKFTEPQGWIAYPPGCGDWAMKNSIVLAQGIA